ncbi:hypothetical protein MFU01_43630 [Myxococcus fulvus]|uniref:Uncharacterized protein n=1 Tax=Myxococcus fulvus TaxID=33 RepID=A0A511T574_MYXFU|nr:hypothetical protein MFU01_43630 [Myxococcus fulvus]
MNGACHRARLLLTSWGMKSVLLAALMVQMTTAGGAGAREKRADAHRSVAEDEDVSKHLSALKNELSSVSEQFRVARERRRLEAEQKKRESGEWTNEPASPAPAAGKRALAPTGGAGTPAP